MISVNIIGVSKCHRKKRLIYTRKSLNRQSTKLKVNSHNITGSSLEEKLDTETAKAAFEAAKMTYQNEYNRFDAIDMKFNYLIVIAGGLMASLGFIFGKDESSHPVYLVIMFLLKFAIISGLGTTLIITMKGLITISEIKTPKCSDLIDDKFIYKESAKALYTLVNSFGDYIDKNQTKANEKCNKFDLACKILIWAFLSIGIKLLIDMVVSLASHIVN